jgi:predicted AAA+ superfamily ATPase
MSDSRDANSDFIADAERHNQWWDAERAHIQDLDTVSALDPRSDVLNCLKRINEKQTEGVQNLAYPIYGPTGIGKTTLLQQVISAILPAEIADFHPGNRDLDIVDNVNPRQVLYVPLEESLYHLERPTDAIEELGRVIDYFYSHVAARTGQKYILLDDVGALRLDEESKQVLLDLIDDETYLIFTGIVESEVDLKETVNSEIQFEWPRAMLPMKFIDTVQQGIYADSVLADSDISDVVESERSTSLDGQSRIKTARTKLSESAAIDEGVGALEDLYFDVFSPRDRDGLHDAAREYLQRGGLFQRVGDDSVNNELVHSHFLLYLYKELAQYESIQRPENLHRLASLAASRAGEELRYTDVSDRLEVDRRTVDTYLSLLDEGLSVSESHDFSLQRHRRTRLYLRNPRHVVLLSQRQEHFGFESYEPTGTLNHEFEYKLARTVAFDHAKRLSYEVGDSGGADPPVEYCETDAGTVDYVLHNEGFVLPFVLSYHPHTGDAEAIATSFDPAVGKHPRDDGEELQDIEYEAPYRFIIADSLPNEVTESESLVVERNGVQLCYLPYWLFLLIC